MLCKECHHKLNTRVVCTNLNCPRCGKDPTRELPDSLRGEIDVFDLADKLKRRREKDSERSIGENPAAPQLFKCPYYDCNRLSLFWNESLLLYECLACKRWVTKAELDGINPLRAQEMHPFEFRKTLLLSVKMFLADVRSWRQKYVEGEYVCADFADEVYKAATENRIQCGYVTVYFEATDMAHAIVAFETDYGLQFFEPQSGEEQIVKVGKPYPVVMEGVPKNAIISSVEIKWNDGSLQSIP